MMTNQKNRSDYYLSAYESMNEDQLSFIKDSLSELSYQKIADKLKIPRVRVIRCCRYLGLRNTHLKIKKEDIDRVVSFYKNHTKQETQREFKDLRVRSIIDKHNKENVKVSYWNASSILKVIRFNVFISKEKQAAILNRPNANKGSIVSVWQKNLKCKSIHVAGLPKWKARFFINIEKCPSVKSDSGFFKVFLWSDMISHTKEECPDFFKEICEAMILFQEKIYGKNVRKTIEGMKNEYRTNL